METVTIQPAVYIVFFLAVATAASIAITSVFGYGCETRRIEKKEQAEVRRKEEEVRREQEKECREQEKKREREELVKLFPQPWMDIWNACAKTNSHRERAILLSAWLSRKPWTRQQYGTSLPLLSLEAVKKLAHRVANSSSDVDFAAASEMLSPHLDFNNLGTAYADSFANPGRYTL